MPFRFPRAIDTNAPVNSPLPTPYEALQIRRYCVLHGMWPSGKEEKKPRTRRNKPPAQ
jgi:hypothetical protein